MLELLSKFFNIKESEKNNNYDKHLKNEKKKYNNYLEKRKSNYKRMMHDNIKKGKEYEKFIGKKFEEKGYIVKYNGIEQGKKDSSIDLIAIKNNNIIFIQCKNWKENSKYKINHEKIKSFLGDSYIFMQKNPQYQNYNINRFFCTSNDIFDKSAKAYMNENKNAIKYKIIPFENKTDFVR